MSKLTSIAEFLDLARPNSVFIFRGISGAGKSTLVEKLFGLMPGMVASADKNRMVDGRYVYDAAKNAEAHATCLRDFIRYAQIGKDEYGQGQVFIAVDNTALQYGTVDVYYRIALAYGWKPVVVTVYMDAAKAAARNTHSVPAASCRRQVQALERGDKNFPKEWTHIRVQGE